MQIFKTPVFFLCLFFAGCDSSGGGILSLSDPAMSEKVDSVSMAPIDPANIFLPTALTLQATIRVSNAPTDTTITAKFYFGEENRKEIAQDALTTNGSGYVSFALDPPESGWPMGAYQVEFYLNGEMKENLTFHIKSKLQPAEASAPTTPAKGERNYTVFDDKQFGFSMELPDTWNFKLIGESSDYLFRGPQHSEEGEIVLIIQIIDTRQPPYSSLDIEMLNQFNTIRQRDKAKIVKKGELQVAGTNAPYFLATYPAKSQQDKLVSWGQTQLGLQNGPIILLISYAAPRAIYQGKVGVFQHMMDSFLVRTPNP